MLQKVEITDGGDTDIPERAKQVDKLEFELHENAKLLADQAGQEPA